MLHWDRKRDTDTGPSGTVADLYRRLLWTVAAVLRKEESRAETEHSLHTHPSFVVIVCVSRRKREKKKIDIERRGLRETIRGVRMEPFYCWEEISESGPLETLLWRN